MIKENEVAVIRTSGERVFVLAVGDGHAAVKRPIATQDGIKHVVEEFLVEELQSPADNLDEEYNERKAFMKRHAKQEIADTVSETLVN